MFAVEIVISLIMLFSYRPAFAGGFITITSSGSGNSKRLCMLIVMLPEIDKNLFKNLAFEDCRHPMRVSPELRDNLLFLQAIRWIAPLSARGVSTMGR